MPIPQWEKQARDCIQHPPQKLWICAICLQNYIQELEGKIETMEQIIEEQRRLTDLDTQGTK